MIDLVNILEKFDYHPIYLDDEGNKLAVYEDAKGGLNVSVVELRAPTQDEIKIFTERYAQFQRDGVNYISDLLNIATANSNAEDIK